MKSKYKILFTYTHPPKHYSIINKCIAVCAFSIFPKNLLSCDIHFTTFPRSLLWNFQHNNRVENFVPTTIFTCIVDGRDSRGRHCNSPSRQQSHAEYFDPFTTKLDLTSTRYGKSASPRATLYLNYQVSFFSKKM